MDKNEIHRVLRERLQGKAEDLIQRFNHFSFTLLLHGRGTRRDTTDPRGRVSVEVSVGVSAASTATTLVTPDVLFARAGALCRCRWPSTHRKSPSDTV